MDSSLRRPFPAPLRLPLLLLVFLGLLASRRWAQLAAPQVWDEEWAFFYGFVHHGWREFLQPINGYLVLVPKLIAGFALAVSPYRFPLLTTLLAWLFIAGVAAAVALAPTRLRGRLACAIALFLVPSDPETFGIALYTLWWASLPLFLVALWREARSDLAWRIGFVIVGGLSSPLIIALLPALYFRAWRFRRFPAERIVAAVATGVAGVQLACLAALPASPALHSSPLVFLRALATKFFGWYLVGNFTSRPDWLVFACCVLLAAILAWFWTQRRRPGAWILLFLLGAAVAASAARVDPDALHPRLAGPRYFFFPYILLAWILIQFFCTARAAPTRTWAALLLGAAALNAVPVWSRTHDDLHWPQHIRSARLFPEYIVPIQYDGTRFSALGLWGTGATWEGLLRRDWLVSWPALERLPTFPYRVLGADVVPHQPKPLHINGSRGAGTAVFLALHHGDRVRFRSGSLSRSPHLTVVGEETRFIPELPLTRDWVWLEFSNAQLPAEFSLELKDEGQGVGEWSAVAPGPAGTPCTAVK